MNKDIIITKIGTKDYALFFQELSNVVGEHCYSFEIENEFASHVCANCKYEKWLNEIDGSLCRFHKHTLNDMFSEDLPLDGIGCKQFVKK